MHRVYVQYTTSRWHKSSTLSWTCILKALQELCDFGIPCTWHPVGNSARLCVCDSVPAFTDQPSELKGYSIHTRLSKGPRGFGFNIVGGSRPREFLQVYSVTPGGPSALKTGEVLRVYLTQSTFKNVCTAGTVWQTDQTNHNIYEEFIYY